jgi:hypothetical protein
VAWIESHTSLADHPKTKRLCRVLKLKRRDAVGLLHMLWWWALDYYPEGDLGAVSDEDIAEAVDWARDPSEVVAALTLAGFLDEGRRLHDWDDYAGRLIERRAANAERKRQARASRQSPGRPPDVRGTSQQCPVLPDRTLTGPDRTGPDRTGPPPPTPPATEREGLSSLPLADAQRHENGAAFDATQHPPPNGARRSKPVLNGRDGWMGCPERCPTNHGGPSAAKFLGEDWLAIPADDRPAWPEFLARHGRPDLADVPAPQPVTQEA